MPARADDPGGYPSQRWVPGTAATAGYTPDYIALLKASPEYQAWLQGATAQNIGFANVRAAAIRELIRRYGGVPAAWKDAYGDIRPEDVAAAQANQFGSMQTIQRNYEQNVNQMRRALAARGMLQSGDLTYGQGQQDLARGEQEATAFGDLMGGIGSAVGDYTTGVAGVQAGEGNIITGVMPTIRELYPATPGKAATAGHWETVPPPAAPKVPPTSFTWGGRTWAKQGPWERYAKAHGINLNRWYRQHAAAAKSIGVKGY